jgi:hypothetical protein
LRTNGYLLSHDPREVLGIGVADKIAWVEIRWLTPSKTGRHITVKEAAG